jgi:hypothetical protein
MNKYTRSLLGKGKSCCLATGIPRGLSPGGPEESRHALGFDFQCNLRPMYISVVTKIRGERIRRVSLSRLALKLWRFVVYIMCIYHCSNDRPR